MELYGENSMSSFPSIFFSFGGQIIEWNPEEYLAIVDAQFPNYFCFGAEVPPEGNSYLLGARFMLNKDVVYMEDRILIYPRSNCGGKDLTQVVNALEQSMIGLQTNLKRDQSHNKFVWIMVGAISLTLIAISNILIM